MSEYMGWSCKENGCFEGCEFLESYGSEKGKHAFVLISGNELAGFALVRGNHSEAEIDFSIAEFFVLRKFRGKGAGENIARQIFEMFRGRWQVQRLQLNKPAIHFWRKVIARHTNGKFSEKSGKTKWGTTQILLFNNN